MKLKCQKQINYNFYLHDQQRCQRTEASLKSKQILQRPLLCMKACQTALYFSSVPAVIWKSGCETPNSCEHDMKCFLWKINTAHRSNSLLPCRAPPTQLFNTCMDESRVYKRSAFMWASIFTFNKALQLGSFFPQTAQVNISPSV